MMKKQKFDLEFFRKAIPADELDANHRSCLFADDCRMVKRFKGNPDHWHFYSRSEKVCFTISFVDKKIKRISNN